MQMAAAFLIQDGSSHCPHRSWKNLTPTRLLAVTGLSLALSLIANIVLMANFGHVLRYSIAQPITIGLWLV
jgi:hypothetical protein